MPSSKPSADGSAVAIVADDMTGAADCVLAFGEAGWLAHLELGNGWTPFPGNGPHVAAALSTDARALSESAACDATERAVRAAREAGADRIYLKVDSTGRGSLAAQIDGARAAFADTIGLLILICPAYPALGRTVGSGRLLVNDVEAAAGAAGADPITPLRSSDLTALVPGARAIGGAPEGIPPEWTGAVVLDGATDGDLERIAQAVAASERRRPVLAVGSAGLARALARVWHPAPHEVAVAAPRTDLVVVSSLHPASRAQIAHARARGAIHEELDVPRLSDEQLQSAIRALLESEGPVIVSTKAERLPGAQGAEAQRIARRLGAAASRAVAAARPRTIGIVGGDGAAALLTAFGAHRAIVAGRIAPGIPLLHLRTGRASLDVWTKAGGFGPPSLLTDLIFPIR
ncbi:hypothetical protein K3N28_15545 [Glycomyces sp. TRM65418]|uniref:four-carbon acid sugar kinase family protein n=1 Tax=Glycomyces sp. TRM65418 TaxID=2867006 RepID=UPI001CE5F3A3|nr:four-carbon acid sugar kinase family protein [Glycomyces sp. TRM65418]MCC3764477.1 hypothetical protein [Glycomyces sp. TRM65418]QZD54150.1 hypothetical protein K3N28_15470 [Glycomyces sp. TRM65418]